MKKWIAMTIVGVAMATALTAQARNVKYALPIAAAVQGPAGTDSLDSSVKLFFGPQRPSGSTQNSGTVEVIGKARIDNKADILSCHVSFVDALQKLQKNAREAGANAVVNIVSYYKNDAVVSSATEFECRAGSYSTILMLKGDLVKLADK